jgi:IS5 family transposase
VAPIGLKIPGRNRGVELEELLKGNDISGTYRISQMWLKEGGSWKLATMQSTKVQSP